MVDIFKMNKTDFRSSRTITKFSADNGSEAEDLDNTIRNISPNNMDDALITPSDAINSNSEEVWIQINQRLEELEKTTQRILADEKRYREQQEAEKDKILQQNSQHWKIA